MNRLDTIQKQVIWNRLLAIIEEQAQVLMRTAFSTVVREAGDLSAGIFDTTGDMLAQAVTGTPGHVNAMARSVRHFLEKIPLEEMEDGDVLLSNDPWLMTGHLNDFTVVSPVFLNAKPIALFASTSHIADVGGRGFGPDASEVFEEGIYVPISYLFQHGSRNETLLELIRANVRDPVVAEGDLYSLTASNSRGASALLVLMNEFDLPSLEEISQYILSISRHAMENEIRPIADGVYKYTMDVDGYDIPIHISCQLKISAESLHIDFNGTSPISAYGINVPLNYTEAYASFGARCLIGNDIPNNAGSLATIAVTAPDNCILNAQPPCAVSARHALGQMLPDVVIGCLSQVLADPVPAEGASCIWNPVLRNETVSTGNFTPSNFVINPIYNGGTGARGAKDGLSTTAFPSGVRTTPTEINEVTAPIIIWRREYAKDSAGAGKYRGGLGQVIEIEHAEGAPFIISKMFERIRHPARGRNGGMNGQSGVVRLKSGQLLRGKGRETVPAGDALIMRTPGGGGIGPPQDRSPGAICADLRANLISEKKAAELYGYDSHDQ